MCRVFGPCAASTKPPAQTEEALGVGAYRRLLFD